MYYYTVIIRGFSEKYKKIISLTYDIICENDEELRKKIDEIFGVSDFVIDDKIRVDDKLKKEIEEL